MGKVECDKVWSELKKRRSESSFFKAAIGYATTNSVLKFGTGDVLVCDASTQAIEGGLTSAKLIQSILKKGGSVFNLPGLHAKVYVFDESAFIGSANLSLHSSRGDLIEAGYFSKEDVFCAQADKLVASLAARGTLIDDKYLSRILKLKVKRKVTWGKRKSSKPVGAQSIRNWVMGVWDRGTDKDEEALEKGYKTAEKVAGKRSIEEIEYPTSDFKKLDLEIGDFLTLVWRAKKKTSTPSYVTYPARVVHVEQSKTEKVTYIYYLNSEKKLSWTKWLKEMKAAGYGRKISRDSMTRGKCGDIAWQIAQD